MSESDREREIVEEGVYYALFRVISIEELSGPEKALEWTHSMVDDPNLRRAFCEGALKAREEREARGPSAED